MRVHAKVHAETQKPRNRAAFSNAFFPLTGHASSQHLDRYVNLDPADVARKAVK